MPRKRRRDVATAAEALDHQDRAREAPNEDRTRRKRGRSSLKNDDSGETVAQKTVEREIATAVQSEEAPLVRRSKRGQRSADEQTVISDAKKHSMKQERAEEEEARERARL